MIGRRPRPIPSHSILYTLPPVPRLTRYQRHQCILSQREYVLNHIDGDLGLLEYPIRIVVSDRPHLVYEAYLGDLLAPTKESTLPKTATTYFALVCSLMAHSNESFTASSNGWNFGWGSAPEVMHLCDCRRQYDSRGAGREM